MQRFLIFMGRLPLMVVLLVAAACEGKVGREDFPPRIRDDADSATDAGADAGGADAGADAEPPGEDAGLDAAPAFDAAPEVDAGPPPPLPLPDMSDMVDALAAERPDLLAGSCVEMGGNNDFLFELVRRLRAVDDRWGLNWKRGVVGDMSQDVVDYHFGHDTRESSTDVYIIDVIVGHCGPTPGAGWIDVTEATRMGGTIGRWTLAGRTDLGP